MPPIENGVPPERDTPQMKMPLCNFPLIFPRKLHKKDADEGAPDSSPPLPLKELLEVNQQDHEEDDAGNDHRQSGDMIEG